jgi:phage regulator Rha-like protein
MASIIPIEIIENKIYVIRGQKVMLDSDLAMLYEVETKILNKAVKRNIDRFPKDFMFQVTDEEWEILRFQIGTSKESKGGRRFKPYVFTEQGVAMLSGVLNSKRAVAVNVQIMRTFVKLRQIALTNKEIAEQLRCLEEKFITYTKETNSELEKHDEKFDEIFRCLQYLADIHKPSKIGFNTDNE